jgi:glycosyltransferase involved in cell wall biosynthesis
MTHTNQNLCFVSPYADVYFDSTVSDPPGGAERQQYLLANQFKEKGYDVSFIVFENNGKNHTESIGGIDVWKTIPRSRSVKSAPQIFWSLFKSIRKIDADVYYVRGNPKLCVLVSLICKLTSNEYIYHIANDADIDERRNEKYSPVLNFAFHQSMSAASQILTQKDTQQKILENQHGLQSDVLPNIYSLPDYSELVSYSDRDHLLWIGRLDRHQKRPELYISLIDELEGTKGIMIGTTNNEKYMAEIKRKVSKVEGLTHIPFVPPDEIYEYYQNSYGLVNTSRYEGFPNTFIEAWRFETPVITFNSVLNGLIERKGMGVCLDDVTPPAEEIQMYLNNHQEMRRIGQNGRKYVKRNHSIEKVFGKYEDIFNSFKKD